MNGMLIAVFNPSLEGVFLLENEVKDGGAAWVGMDGRGFIGVEYLSAGIKRDNASTGGIKNSAKLGWLRVFLDGWFGRVVASCECVDEL